MNDKIKLKLNKDNAQPLYEELMSSSDKIYSPKFECLILHPDFAEYNLKLGPEDYKNLCVALVEDYKCQFPKKDKN